MLLELVLALLLGIVAGTIAGLLPGVHSNLIAVFLVSTSVLFIPYFPPIVLVVFIVAMATCQSFLDFIPSIFLGAPDEDSVLSVLPGHEMLIKGKGYEAVIYTLYRSIIAIPIILLLSPLFVLFLPSIFSYLQLIMFFILLSSSLYLIFREKTNKIWALIVFLLSGFLGIATLNLNLQESLLPLLTGLFGSSSLITSIMKKTKLPEQEIKKLREIKVSKGELGKISLASILSAPLCSFLPALGSSQAAVIGLDIIGETNQKQFLILLGSLNTIVMGLSFVTLYSIQKSRTGSAVAISKLLQISFSDLFIILFAILFAGILAFFLTIFIAKFFAGKISHLNYNKLSIFILLFLSAVVLFFSGFLGFLIFITATFTGLIAILIGVRRTNLMGSLMLPTILFYAP